MAATSSSSVQQIRQLLANRLGELRRDAGLTGRDIATRCDWHPAKSSRIENAVTAPSAEDIRAWCRACDADDQVEDLIATMLAADGMWVEWRRMERAGLRAAQESVLPLYERTHQFRAYSSWLIPGLIQTADMTRAVLRAIQERRGLVDDVEEALAARMDRQRVLYGSRRFAFLVEESVLRNSVGDAEVTSGQLHHLINVSGLPNVSLGIVPMRPGRARWPAEGFWIYDNAQVNVELVSGYLTITQPREIRMYEATFTELAAVAVYGARARELITAAVAALG